MKKSLILASLLLAGTSVVANDYFVGLEYLNMDMPESVTLNGVNVSPTPHGKDTNFNLKFGIDNIAQGKIYLQTGKLFSIVDSDGDKVEYSSTSINYDYYLPLKSNNIQPYIGAGIGYGKYYPYAEHSNSDTDLNFKIGASYTTNNNFQFELGYKYVKTNATVDFINEDGDKEHWSVDKITGLYLGMNYKF
jgi:outer membrane protein W